MRHCCASKVRNVQCKIYGHAIPPQAPSQILHYGAILLNQLLVFRRARACPELVVVAQKLQNPKTLLVFGFVSVQQRQCLIKRLLRQCASLVGSAIDLIVENSKVEGQAEAKSVLWSKSLLCNLHRLDVGIVGVPRTRCSLGCWSDLSLISVIIALHLHEEDMSLGICGLGHKLICQEVQNIAALF